MKESKIQVAFASIDAKDDYFCGYSTVAFSDGKTSRFLVGKKNMVHAIMMEREYLTRLKKLQDEIAEKYLRLYDPNDPPVEESVKTWDGALTQEEHEAAVAAALATFPGEEAPYYD